MQLDISKCIADYLIRNDSISFPGIGSLSLYDINDDFIKIADEIVPPRRSIRFNSNEANNSNFQSYLAKSVGISLEQASSVIKDYSDQILETIDKDKSFEIEGIGVFAQSDDNRLMFKSLDKNFNEKYAYYPTIKLSPLPALEVTNESKDEEVFNTLETRNDAKLEANQPAFEKIGKVSAIGREEAPLKQDMVQHELSKTEPMAYNTPDQNPHYYDEADKGLFSHIGVPLLWLILLGLLVFFLLRWAGCGDADGIKGTAADVVNTVGDTKDNVVDATLDLVDGNGSTDYGKYSDVLTDEIVAQGCVIVVGSFKRNRNAIRMRDKIINMGYQPYEEPIKGFNRVGIVIDCLERDLVEVIQEVRRTIEPKAWYRIPGFRVPYE